MAEAGDALTRVLAEIQRRGGVGSQPIAEAIAHSDRFVAACPASARVGVDLGSGGGLPGLVLAVRRPELTLHLLERRATRADLLRYGVAALRLDDRVFVHVLDARRPLPAEIGDVDLVTARSFAAHPVALVTAARILGRAGWVLISEGPIPSAISAETLTTLRLVDDGIHEGIHRYSRMFHVEPSHSS